MKEFDWKEAEKIHNPQKLEVLRRLYNQTVSEAEYVAETQKVRANSIKPSSFNPSKMRADYRRLKKNFGFFH